MTPNISITNIPVVLASGSPRRRSMLQAIGIDPIIIKPDVSEDFPEDMNIASVPLYLAAKKCQAVLEQNRELVADKIIITADTIVTVDNELLGKPRDENEAMLFLQKLSGKTHKVISGVRIKYQDKTYDINAVSQVQFKELTTEEIAYYVTNYLPLDKAGAYAIQEFIGMIGITSIQGDYYSIVGMPIHQVYEKLVEININGNFTT